MSKLEPTEAQRKAIIEFLSRPYPHYDPSKPDYEGWLDAFLAAANSIPEGAPVGTIARRPDGRLIAVRSGDGRCGDSPHWNPVWVYVTIHPGEGRGTSDDADSWSQIRPDEWPVSETYSTKEAAEALGVDLTAQQEPSVDDALDNAAADYIASLANTMARANSKVMEALAQQEPEAFNRFPGIENVTAADRIGADNADAQLGLVFKLRDIRIGRGLEISDVAAAMEVSAAEVARFESGSTNPRMSMIRRYARAVEAVFTVDVRKWEDSPAQQEPEGCSIGLDGECEGKCQTQKPPRTARVVDRLGVDEQGSRWRNRHGNKFEFHDGSWFVNGIHIGPGDCGSTNPFTEILEPRVLPSLDCEEARDGTVWQARYALIGDREQTPGWKFRHTADGWVYEDDGTRVMSPEFLTDRGPYTEVLS